MKVVTVRILARDQQDVIEINSHLEDSGVLNEWPVVSWGTDPATQSDIEWFRGEYGEEVDDDEEVAVEAPPQGEKVEKGEAS